MSVEKQIFLPLEAKSSEGKSWVVMYGGMVICRIDRHDMPELNELYAKFICLAANNHDRLVKALQAIKDHEEERFHVNIGYDRYIHEMVKAVLAKIDKEQE